MMNRQERRAARARGLPVVTPADRARARRLVDAEAAALTMTPERAREILGRWAAEKGHTVEEVERLNGEGQKAFQGKLR